jgi:fructoselysine-6-P-deglycase FrlB-like protein
MASPELGAATTAEINTQPECWARALKLSKNEPAGLPPRAERVLVLGCGTSYYMAEAYATLREQSGIGETDAVVASELPEVRRRYDRVVALSRSGTSAEVVEAMSRLKGEAPLTAIVGVASTPVAELADHVIDLGFADEQSVVQTRFATTTLATLRSALGEELGAVISDAQRAVESALPRTPGRQLVILGTGWAASLAQEGALKCRESAAAWVEAYPAGEYRHGPIAAADEDTLVWALNPLTDMQRTTVLESGASLEEGQLDPMAELIRIQRLAVRWAAERGRDADSPRNLTRSVTDV